MLATLAPGDPEARGLAALIELSAARAPARTDADGRFVPLADQDPSRWDQRLIGRAHEHLRAAHARGQLGRFQLEAAIQAVHCAGDRDGATDWPTLLTLHRILHAVAPSLGSSVALAAVTAEVDGPAAGLAALDALLAEAGQPARRFQPARATRAHLLDRLGRERRGRRGVRERDQPDPRRRRTPVPGTPPGPRRRSRSPTSRLATEGAHGAPPPAFWCLAASIPVRRASGGAGTTPGGSAEHGGAEGDGMRIRWTTRIAAAAGLLTLVAGIATGGGPVHAAARPAATSAVAATTGHSGLLTRPTLTMR